MENFRGLAIEGGGVAGIIYLGNLIAFQNKGFSLSQFTHFAGSSAGSIVGAFLAVRAPLKWMEEKMRSTNFSDFMDDSWGITQDLYRLYDKYGWYAGDKLYAWVKDALEEITGNGNITFAEVYQIYRTHLIITKTDVLFPRCKLVAMDHESHPDVSIADAVRASSSIPGFFAACFEGNNVFVDGGVLLNYPIELLYQHLPREEVMGLYLTSASENIPIDSYRPVTSYMEFLSSIGNTWRDNAIHRHITNGDWKRTCSTESNIGSTDFKLTKKQQDEAIELGIQSMNKFISSKSL